MKIKTTTVIVFLIAFFANISYAGDIKDEQQNRDVRSEYKEFKDHHLKDNHSFKIFYYKKDKKKKYISFPLPIIVYSEKGLDFFMSSSFYNDENKRVTHTVEDRTYEIDKKSEKIKATLSNGEELKIIDFSITKNVILILVCALLMIFVFTKMARSYSKNSIPSGAGRFLEPIVLYIRDDIARPNIGEKHYRRYMGFLLTVFFFIWFVNLFGLTPIGSNVTNNIAVTASLAVLTYLITTFTANKNYWGHIFWMPGVPTPMKLILAPIELLGTIIKPFSLMIRLYANMTAGHVVLMSILGLIFIFQSWLGGTLSFGLAFALCLLELLVCALQAYIFTMLSALYFGAAVEEHHHD
jgi:F-type H+-transporting ATPase subunit a